MRLALLLSVLLCSFNVAAAQTEPADLLGSGVESVYLAKDDGNGKAGEPVLEFKASDIPIYCVVMLEANGKSVVKMVFVAVTVSGVKPETKVVTSAYTTSEGQNRVTFTGRPDGNWTPGKYRVDIFVDNKLATNIEFVIRANSKSFVPKAAKSTAAKRPKKPGGQFEP